MSKPHPVTVRVMSGLGNRMRALCGSMSLAAAAERPLLYRWPTSATFEPRLTDLWAEPGRRIGAAEEIYRRTRSRRFDERLDRFQLSDGRAWYVRTKHALALPEGVDDWGVSLRSLEAVPAVNDRVLGFWEEHLATSPYVGIMIRASAATHEKTKAASPVTWYEGRMRGILEWWPDVTFFVSTDDTSVADRLQRTFERVHVLPDKGAYNSVRGVQSAVADLYLLASSSGVLGPYWSSFAMMAKQLAPTLTLEDSATGTAEQFQPSSQLTSALDPTHPWIRRPAAAGST